MKQWQMAHLVLLRIQQKLKALLQNPETPDDEVEEEQPEATNETHHGRDRNRQGSCREKNGKKNMFIEGIFLQGNLKNRNGRFYPVETLEKEVNRYNEAFVGKGRALGELGHPEGRQRLILTEYLTKL